MVHAIHTDDGESIAGLMGMSKAASVAYRGASPARPPPIRMEAPRMESEGESISGLIGMAQSHNDSATEVPRKRNDEEITNLSAMVKNLLSE